MASVLPAAIQRQVEEAEALERELYGQEEVTSTDPQETPSEPEALTPKEPELQTEEAPAPEIKAKPGREEDVEYWKARANTLYGMNQQQAYELQQVKANLQELSQEVARSRSTEPTPQPSKDNDAETFGEDLVDVIDRRAEQKAQQLVSRELKQTQDYVKTLEAKLGVVNEHVAETQEERFYNTLRAQQPEWETINTSPAFLSWLGEVDELSGYTRQQLLDSAAQRLDANRVASIFAAYNKLTGKQVNQQQRQQVRQELERQVAPQSTKTSAAVAPAGRVWTVTEYEQALDPRNINTMGKARADQLYAEAEAAYAEGRIRF